MAGKLPCFAFYPADWLKDPALRACSFEGRGFWMDVLCLMWECPERGVLKTGQNLSEITRKSNSQTGGTSTSEVGDSESNSKSGHVWGAKTLAKALGISVEKCRELMRELLRKGVCSKRDVDGAIYSKRMVVDDIERKRWRESKRSKRDNVPLLSTQIPAVSSSSPSSTKEQSQELSLTPPAFDRFWQAYPRKVARTQAEKAWRKIPEADATAVLEGLEVWKKSAQWAEVEFVPYPATWLNRQQWSERPVEGSANGKHQRDRKAGGAVHDDSPDYARVKAPALA